MKHIRRLTGCLMALLLSAGLCLPALAQGYTLAATENASQFDGNGIHGFYVHPDGSIDCFPAEKGKYVRYFSADGGKSWTPKSLAPLEKLDKTGERTLKSIALDDEGNVLAVVTTGVYQVETKRVVAAYYTYGLAIQNKDGAVRMVPGFELREANGMNIDLMPIPGGKEVAVSQWADEARQQSTLYIVDLATGQIKKTLKTPPPLLYSQGRVFGFDLRENGLGDLVATDVASGKELYRGRWQFDAALDDGYGASAWTAGNDGSFYGLNHTGIYRLAPGGTAFEKVLDGRDCIIGQKGVLCLTMAVGNDGDIYLLAGAFTKDAPLGQDTKLYRYKPAQSK